MEEKKVIKTLLISIGMEENRRYQKESQRHHARQATQPRPIKNQRVKSSGKRAWGAHVSWKKSFNEDLN